MENKKSLACRQGLFFKLLGLSFFGFCIALGITLPANLIDNFWNSSDGGSHSLWEYRNSNYAQASANPHASNSIEQLRSSMFYSWEHQARLKGLNHAIPKRFQGVTLNSVKLNSGAKTIALTFDDGPWPGTTAQILDILKKNNIKATFFVVGQVLQAYPQLGKRIVNEGHVIGNHTWHHRYHYFNSQAAAFEINKTAQLIEKSTGVKPNLFRPPGGILDNGLAKYAKAQKQTVVMWSADSHDYKQPSVSQLVRNVMRDAKPGGIVLMHDGGGNRSRTVQALPVLINSLRQQGYKFVTVPELLKMAAAEREKLPGRVTE